MQAQVPAGSSVVQAYLYGTYVFSPPTLAARTIDFDGTAVVLDPLAHSEPGGAGLSTARANVTAQVAAKVGGGGAVTDFAVNSDPTGLDGIGLVVVFANPGLPETTIAVLDGGSKPAGDTITVNFDAPIDPSAPGFFATLALGSGFSSQGSSGHVCGSGSQSSLVDVNAARLTSCAGNYDDGAGGNGALVTVGGVGDSTNNPSDPNQRPGDGTTPRGEDDELYDLVPFLDSGDTQLVIGTSNPSRDDNLFLAVIAVTAQASVTTEVCDNGVDDDGDSLVDDADPDCHLCRGLTATVPGATEGNDTLTGTSGPDVIIGRGGDDTISGLGGDDKLCGGDGHDRIKGGAGDDRMSGQGDGRPDASPDVVDYAGAPSPASASTWAPVWPRARDRTG